MHRIHIKHFPSNNVGRDFIVGDIHGCFFALEKLLSHVGFHKARDRLFSVGDLVDRGPQSAEALALLKKPWFYACRGNHEEMLAQHLRSPQLFEPHDAQWLKKVCPTYTHRQKFAGEYLNALENLPNVLAVGDPHDPHRFFVVHAEILESRGTVTERMIFDDNFSNPEKTHHRALWGRSLFHAFVGNKPVKRAHDENLPLIFCGHTVVPHALKLARQVFLDGGAFVAFDKSVKGGGNEEGVYLRMFDTSRQTLWECSPQSGKVREGSISHPPTI